MTITSRGATLLSVLAASIAGCSAPAPRAPSEPDAPRGPRPRTDWIALWWAGPADPESAEDAGEAPDRGIWSVDQRGLWKPRDPHGTAEFPAYAAPFRVFAAARDADSGAVVLAGGTPGEGGSAVRLSGDPLRAGPVGVIADCVVEAVTLRPGRPEHCIMGLADGRVVGVEGEEFARATVLTRHGGACRAVAFHPRGHLVASAGLDSEIRLVTTSDGSVRVLRDHSAGIEALCWSDDGEVLASAALDGRVRFHAVNGRLLGSTAPHDASALSLAAIEGTDRFAVGYADGSRASVSVARPDRPDRVPPAVSEPFPIRALLPIPGADGANSLRTAPQPVPFAEETAADKGSG